jgi:HEAT repeat protein
MYRSWLAGLSLCLILTGCGKTDPRSSEKPKSDPGANQKPPDSEPQEALYKGHPLAVWVKKSQDKDAKVREEAIVALGNFQDEGAIKTLAERVKQDKEADLRKLAVITLRPYGPKAKTELKTLIEALQDSDEYVRFEAAITLGKLGPEAKEAVPELQKKLEDNLLRQVVIPALGEIGPEARSAVPKLIELLKKEKKESVRVKTVIALGKIDPENQKVLAALGEAFRDSYPGVQQEAELVLVSCGDKAVQTLLKNLNDPDKKVSSRAISALEKIGPPAKAAVPDLRLMLRHKDLALRLGAEKALKQIKPEEVVPALIEALKSEEPDVRRSAAASLTRYDKAAKAAVPILLERLADGNAEVLDAAALALLKIEREHKDIVPALAKRLKEAKSDARDKAFKRISDFGKPAVAPLLEIVKDALEEDKLIQAVDALGRIGMDAKEGAWVEILALYKNEDSGDAVRGAARDALRKIDPRACLRY